LSRTCQALEFRAKYNSKEDTMNKYKLIYYIDEMLNMIDRQDTYKYGLCDIVRMLGIDSITTNLLQAEMKEEFERYNTIREGYVFWWRKIKLYMPVSDWYEPRIKFLEDWKKHLNMDNNENIGI
jgi:hypothetical protein